MSLSNTQPPRQFAIGIVAPKDFDNPQVLEEQFSETIDRISHVYTNGANDLVINFARQHGLPLTVYPITAGNGLPKSTRLIVEASEFVLIITTPVSKSTKLIMKACEDHKVRVDADARAAKELGKTEYPVFTFRELPYDPVGLWKGKHEELAGKIGKVAEILACMTKEDVSSNLWIKSVLKAID